MKTMAHHATAAIRFGLIVLALTLLETQSSAGQGAQKPIQVTPPLWQGTPFIDHENVFFNGSALGYQCQTVFTAAAGTAVLLKMIVANYNVPTGGGGSAFVAITLPGAPYGSPLRIPMHADAPSAGKTCTLASSTWVDFRSRKRRRASVEPKGLLPVSRL